MSDSQRLLAEYAETGSENAFRELVRRYIDLVYSAAVRLVDGEVPAGPNRLKSGIPLRIDQPPDRRDTIGGNAELAGMLVNGRLVWREIDTVDAVVSDVAVKPLDFLSHFFQDFARLHGNGFDLGVRKAADAGDLPLDDELWHNRTILH